MGQKSQPGTRSRESSPKQFTQQQRKGSVWTKWEGERAQFSMGRKTGRQGSVKLALGLFPFCRHLTESFFRGGTLERRQRAKRFRWGSGSFQKASAWAPSDRRSEAQLGTRLYGAWWNSGHWRARRWILGILATGSFGNVHGRKKEFHGMQPGPRAVRLDVLFFFQRCGTKGESKSKTTSPGFICKSLEAKRRNRDSTAPQSTETIPIPRNVPRSYSPSLHQLAPSKMGSPNSTG